MAEIVEFFTNLFYWLVTFGALAGLGYFAYVIRGWAVWYLAKVKQEDEQARRDAIHAAELQIIAQRDDAEAFTSQVWFEFVERDYPDELAKYRRPAKAAKLLAEAKEFGNPCAYIAEHATDPDTRARYAAWRKTQTRRRLVAVGE